MKPTGKQMKIIDSLIRVMSTWKSTNDINSPTVMSDIREFLKTELDELIDDRDRAFIEGCLEDLLLAIRHTEKKPNLATNL